jgi:hypothetical protein
MDGIMNTTDNFNNWMHSVDVALEGLCGMSYMDLPDKCYRDWFEDGIEPEEAAQMVLDDELGWS